MHGYLLQVRSFLLVLLLASIAWGAPLDDAARDLSSSDFDRVAAGVAAIGSSGHPRALEVLEALSDRSLVIDEAGRLLIATSSGTLDALTGEPHAARGRTKGVEANNRIRRSLGVFTSRLRLLSPDIQVRSAAAEELSKSPTEDARATLEAALQGERDDGVRDFLLLAQARLDLNSTELDKRLAAMKIVRAQAELALKTEVENFLKKDAAGNWVEPSQDVRREAEGALSAINTKLFFINAVANTFYGLSLGSVLLLAALGLSITFGLMNVINMAHGEMLMIGAYTTFVVQNAVRDLAPALFDFYLWLAVPAAFLVCALVGMGLERLVVRHLYGRPLETLLATWGISLVLIQTVRIIFGAQNVTVQNPEWLSGGFELLPTLVLPYSRIAIVIFTGLVVALVVLVLTRTSFGLQIRAVTQNRGMAASMGISTRKVDLLTFGLGSGLAGLGGVALSQLGNVGPELGQSYIVDSFMVVVLGGVGKLVGTVLGAFGLGVLNKYVEPAMGAVLGKILILVLIVLFIQKRPQGLFAMKGRAAEA